MSYDADTQESITQNLIDRIKEIEERMLSVNSVQIQRTGESQANRGIDKTALGTGAFYPLNMDVFDHGSIGLLTETLFIDRINAHAHKMELTGDIGLAFSNPPDDTKSIFFFLEITQDGTGGWSITSFPTGLQNSAELDSQLDKAVGGKTLFRFFTLDGGVTYWGERVDLSITGSGTFATIELNNLGTTAINADLKFDAATYDIGDGANPLDNIFVNNVRLRNSTLVANIPMITSVGGSSVDINFPTGSGVNYYVQGVATGHSMSATSITAVGLIVDQMITMNDNALDPVSNGQFSRNVTHVKVYSGGAVRNLSDIGVASGATTELDNLGTTAINADLLFDAATYDVGDTTNPIDQLFMKTVRLQSGTLTANKPTITSIGGSSVDINFPTGSGINYYVQGVATGHAMTATSITAVNMIVSEILTFSDDAGSPVSNGQFRRNGTHTLAYSGDHINTLSHIDLGAIGNALWDSHETTEFDFEVYHSNSSQGGNETTYLPTEDQVYFVPIFIKQHIDIERLGIEVVAVTGSFDIQMSLFDTLPGQNYPNNRIAHTDSVSSGTGTKSVFLSPNEELRPGLYFISFLSNDNDTLEVRGITEGHGNSCGYKDEGASGFTEIMMYWYSSGVMPTHAPDDMNTSTSAILMFFKCLPA